VFPETSLERKCRWWFGISLGTLIFLSFYWYSGQTRDIVFDGVRRQAKQLVETAYSEAHIAFNPNTPMSPGDATGSDGAFEIYSDMMGAGRFYGTEFRWDTVIPPGGTGLNPPQDTTEKALLAHYMKARLVEPDDADQAGDADLPREDKDLPEGIGIYDRIVEIEGQQTYQYYRPIYARASCVGCHKQLGKSARASLQEGELLAIMRINFNHGPIARKLAAGTALLWTAAIVTGLLSMVSLYFVVRYVIVRPVKHLRDVSNAVREGDVSQRAEIFTGDEFEELGNAFNRMVRQLLDQRDKLVDVNSELDAKLDELAQANMRLFEMNRIKSDFLATMSHELRTPLNSILGFSDVLSGIDALNDKQKRYVSNIQRSGNVLLEMINDILDLAKMESGRMEIRPSCFTIENVITAQCDMARPLAERKNIDVVVRIEPGLPKLEQDQAKIQQILNNLLSNAIKFTPEGGRITIDASRSDDGQLEIKVDDTGIGISESEQQLVFEKFRQGTAALPGGDAMTREHSGTGLGLSIVRELCRLLGGEVSLSSVVGKGSTFTVTLPWVVDPRLAMESRMNDDVKEFSRSGLGDPLHYAAGRE
jgi:signal transduction histidine kinase